jgi:hypothetical protein
MTRNTTLTLFVILASALYGQDTTTTTATSKIREYYLTVSDVSPVRINIKYKRQAGQKSFIKLGLINLSAFKETRGQNSSATFPVSGINYSGGILFGIEFRKPIGSKFSLFHGPNLSYLYQKAVLWRLDPSLPVNQQRDNVDSHTASIPYSLGLLFNITSNILLSAEINPAVSFFYEISKTGEDPRGRYTDKISFALDNRQGLNSLVYRL